MIKVLGLGVLVWWFVAVNYGPGLSGSYRLAVIGPFGTRTQCDEMRETLRRAKFAAETTLCWSSDK